MSFVFVIYQKFKGGTLLSQMYNTKIFCIFFQSTHQVSMKNIVECYKEFFGYFNALETNGALTEKFEGIFKISFVVSDRDALLE